MVLARDETTIYEKSTPTIYATILKAQRIGRNTVYRRASLADISALTLTYYADDDAKTIINSRNNQDVLNAGNVTITDNGEMYWELQAADTAIINSSDYDTGELERHIAQFKFTMTGSKVFYYFLDLFIKQLEKVS